MRRHLRGDGSGACGRGRTWPAHSGGLGTPPHRYYGRCARSSLDGLDFGPSTQARPGVGGEASHAEPLERRDGAPGGAARTLARHQEPKVRRPALHPPRIARACRTRARTRRGKGILFPLPARGER
jgi:hypothetical protein